MVVDTAEVQLEIADIVLTVAELVRVKIALSVEPAATAEDILDTELVKVFDEVACAEAYRCKYEVSACLESYAVCKPHTSRAAIESCKDNKTSLSPCQSTRATSYHRVRLHCERPSQS